MMERLTKGQVIKMTSGKECRVLKELGEGGQGYIYKVRYEGKDMALKWYKMDKIADKGKFYRKHRLTRAHREKQLKMSCQALHNAPPNRT